MIKHDNELLANMIFENALAHITIVGIWGLLGEKLVNPSTPYAEPIVIYENYQTEEHGYVISEDKSFKVPVGSLLREADDGNIIITQRLNVDSKIRLQLLEYISGEVIVCRHRGVNTNVGSLDKYTFPLIRRVYPSLIASDLVSIQPLAIPKGLAKLYKIEE